MASEQSQYDDPAVLNRFLAIISAEPLPVTPPNMDEPAIDGPATTSSTTSSSPSLAQEIEHNEETESSGNQTEGEKMASQPSSLPSTALNSPAVGARAPPSTPASLGAGQERANHLSSVMEGDGLLLPLPALVDDSNLLGSKFANPWFVPSSSKPARIAARSARNIASRAEIDDADKFVSNAIEAAVVKAEQGDVCEDSKKAESNYKPPSVTSDGVTSTDTGPFPTYEETVAPLESHHFDDRDYQKNNPDAQSWETAWRASGSYGQTSHMAPLVDDHDDPTLHCDCGAVLADDLLTARTRTAIMSNLPFDADLTFVQGLVNGGVLEKIELLSGPEGGNSMAFVRFGDADACDRYVKRNAEGIQIPGFGKTTKIGVATAFDVDPLSIPIRSYLECGATRVIQLLHVDDSLSTRALSEMAADGFSQKHIESVSDVFRNNKRVVTICFASIVHAVSFRVKMTKEKEWAPANIKFVEDPCEKL